MKLHDKYGDWTGLMYTLVWGGGLLAFLILFFGFAITMSKQGCEDQIKYGGADAHWTLAAGCIYRDAEQPDTTIRLK